MLENVHYFPVTYETLADDLKRFAEAGFSKEHKIARNAYNDKISEFRYSNFIPDFEQAAGLINDIEEKSNESKIKDIYIWGTNSEGKHCLNTMNPSQYHCRGFIDNNTEAQGTTVLGKHVFSPDEILDTVAKEGNMYIIIAVKKIDTIREIYRQLRLKINSEKVLLFYGSILLTENVNLEKLLEVSNE